MPVPNTGHRQGWSAPVGIACRQQGCTSSLFFFFWPNSVFLRVSLLQRERKPSMGCKTSAREPSSAPRCLGRLM